MPKLRDNILLVGLLFILGIALYDILPILASENMQILSFSRSEVSHSESIHFEFESKSSPNAHQFRLFNSDSIAVDSAVLKPEGSPSQGNPHREIHKLDYDLNNLEDGWYCWENKVCFFVIDDAKTYDFSILYPLLNIQAYNNFDGSGLFTSNPSPAQNSIDTRRPMTGDFEHSAFIRRMISLYPQYSFQVITDVDLLQGKKLQSKRLILFGLNDFLPKELLDDYKSYLQEGKDILLLTGNFGVYQCSFDGNILSPTMNGTSKAKWRTNYEDFNKIFGSNYFQAFKEINQELKFTNSLQDTISLALPRLNGINIRRDGSSIIPDSLEFLWKLTEVLERNTYRRHAGVSIAHHKSGGKVYSFGSTEIYKRNLKDEPELKRILDELMLKAFSKD